MLFGLVPKNLGNLLVQLNKLDSLFHWFLQEVLGNLCAFTLVTNCLLRTVKTVLLHNWKNRFHHSFIDFCKKCSAEKCQHPHLANKLLHYRLCESGALGEDAHPFQGGHFAQCGPEALLQLYVGLLYPENYRHRKILQSAFPRLVRQTDLCLPSWKFSSVHTMNKHTDMPQVNTRF